jgi:hypothetical protein
MDITDSTKQLNSKVQALKPKFPDAVSTLFIEFYCQCKEGIDYLFPLDVKDSIRLLDILQWFFDCVEKEAPTLLVELMWKDVIGPTFGEYKQDQAIEKNLRLAFQNGEVKKQIQDWDRLNLNSGKVSLILRSLLEVISQIEKEHKNL